MHVSFFIAQIVVPEESAESTVIAEEDPREVETSLPEESFLSFFDDEWLELIEEVKESLEFWSVLDSSFLLLSLVLVLSDGDLESAIKMVFRLSLEIHFK